MDESRRAFLWTGAFAVPLLLSRGRESPKPSPSVSVRDYGARGDREAKDTRAIQAAIDNAAATGRTVRFPAGTATCRARFTFGT